MKRALVILLLLFMAIIGSVLTELNVTPVEINYYFGSAKPSLALLLLLVFSSGALLGLLFSAGIVLSAQHEKRQLRRRLLLREQEIRNLRDIPIKGRH